MGSLAEPKAWKLSSVFRFGADDFTFDLFWSKGLVHLVPENLGEGYHFLRIQHE